MKKLLVLSPGRQVQLVRELGGHFTLGVGDNSPLTLACYSEYTTYRMPRYLEAEYAETLVGIVTSEGYEAVISLHDVEVVCLARLRDELERRGCIVLVPPVDKAEACLDKYDFALLCASYGLHAPRTVLWSGLPQDEVGLDFPCLLKPRRGMGSRSHYVVRSLHELQVLGEYLRIAEPEGQWVMQEFLQGVEYGLDVVNDLQGRYFVSVVKRKLAMRGGETDAAMVVHDAELERLARDVSRMVEHRGNADCDVLVSNGVPYLLDVNPRFGGGYSFSWQAGLDVPRYLSVWMEGGELDAAQEVHLERGLICQRTSTLIPVDGRALLGEVELQ